MLPYLSWLLEGCKDSHIILLRFLHFTDRVLIIYNKTIGCIEDSESKDSRNRKILVFVKSLSFVYEKFLLYLLPLL